MTAESRRTPLHEWHVAHGGRMVPFGGWSMPVQYPAGILAEHRTVRAAAGLFDISHMGRVEVRGPDALELLQRTTSNDVTALVPMRAQYSLLCNEQGGVLDDLIIYRLEDHYLVVVNASNRERDLAWWREQQSNLGLAADLVDRTFDVAMIALQGPAAESLLQSVAGSSLAGMRYYSALRSEVGGHDALLARTGYTGEDGFELMVPSTVAVALWEGLLRLREPAAPAPAGLGARDTLRLEAGMALYGNELNEDTTPLEAGLDRFVKLGKLGFVGREALAAQQATGVPRRLVGFEMVDSAIPRHGYAVTEDGRTVGQVTSGNFGPTVQRQIGMAYVPPRLSAVDSEFSIVVRERTARARITPLPFYRHRTKRGTRAAE